jgi:RNA polymerase sigma-70 factor (ECF subfamily)
MELTDVMAASEARKGDQHAFRVLVERHSRSVFRLAFRMTGNEQDAEDLVQETFLRAWKQMHKFDNDRAAFGTWLYRIATNCSLDLIRSRQSRRKQQSADTDDARSWLDDAASPLPSPEQIAHGGQIAALMSPALSQLSAVERAAFVLRHYEGCSIDEIASALGVANSAAKQSVFRAIQKLRRTLQPLWGVAR